MLDYPVSTSFLFANPLYPLQYCTFWVSNSTITETHITDDD